MDEEQQGIVVELMPSQDRCAILVMLRSGNPMKGSSVSQALREFATTLDEKFALAKSKIQQVKKPGLILP